MIKINNLSLRFGKRVLFDNVNIEFKNDNCYGVIGANGAGKTTFLKLLSGEIESTSGEIIYPRDTRISILKQNHNEYNEYTAIETVIMGNNKLYQVMKEKEALYAKPDFSDADGIRAGELEDEFLRMDGWSAEADASTLLSGLGIDNSLHYTLMGELKDTDKIKVLLASALFGEPDVLLLDEPTNGLDIESKCWLEEFLINFKNTIIVVSHDRYFLNKVCTHIVDIDYEKISLFIGNYDFWYESSQLIQKQMRDSNKKKEEKIEELKKFIARFSANASKSKQATSRKKLLDKIVLEEIKPSSRKYPYINFDYEKRLGKEVISLSKINYEQDGIQLFKNLNLNISNGDKIGLVGNNEIAKTALFKIIVSEINNYDGEIKIGSSVKIAYFPKNHDEYFREDINMIDWLRNFSTNKEETFIRGFLGKMLFSGEESLKSVKVLSGGEKVRCMLAKIMLEGANVLLLDEPTNHLDMETITALNEGMKRYTGTIIFSSFDEELLDTVANRIIDIKGNGKYVDKYITYSEYMRKE